MLNLIRRLQRKLLPLHETIEGYEQAQLVETIFQKTLKYEPHGEWPLMVGASTVLDFGGGCGLHYKLARKLSLEVKWAVVETPAMVARASELSTERLRFFADMHEAAQWLGSIQIMHSNGALQYTPNPLATLRDLCKLGAATMAWTRVLLSQFELKREVQTSFLGDNGPGPLPGGNERLVKYTRTWIPEAAFVDAHTCEGYELTERGLSSFCFSRRKCVG